MVSYNRKAEARGSRNGMDCYVFNFLRPRFYENDRRAATPLPGDVLPGILFRENNVALYDSFWEDAKRSLTGGELHCPELAVHLSAH